MSKQPSHSEIVVPLLRSLRGEIMAAYGKVDHTLKDDLTVVTHIDELVEQKIIDELKRHFPTIGFLGEEHGQHGSTDAYWLIDPIDGTESYVRGLSGVMSILGLVENNICTQAYIYDPVEDTMYSAFKDMGAYADEVAITVSERPLQRAMLAMGSKMVYREPDTFIALKETGVYHLTQYFGAASKAVYLATGKIEGIVYHNQGGGPWDHIATKLLAIEAGAVYTEFDAAGNDSRSYSLLTPTVEKVINQKLSELWQ